MSRRNNISQLPQLLGCIFATNYIAHEILNSIYLFLTKVDGDKDLGSGIYLIYIYISGGVNVNPLQYSYLENSMDRGAPQAIVYESQRVGHD